MRLYLFLAVLPALIQAKSLATGLAKDSHCSFANEALNVSWTFDAPSSDVVFKLLAQSRSKNFWAGLFLGNDRPEDSIGAFVRNGQIGVMDGHVVDDRLLVDNTTNLQSLVFDLQNYKLTAEFARALTTSDKSDGDLSQCITFFFPTQPLEIDSAGQIRVPKDLQSKRVCNIQTSCKTESIGGVDYGDVYYFHQKREKSKEKPQKLQILILQDVVKRSDATVCEHTQGKNIIRWQKVGDEVKFSIGQSVKPEKWWSAIGVGQGMADLKIAAAFLENGEVKNMGGYHAQGYGVPAADDTLTPKLDAENSKVVDDRSVVQFSLPMELFTSRFDDSGCVTLQIASEAGEWSDDFVFKKHQNTPEAVLVCGIDQCSATLEIAGSAEAGVGAEAVTGAAVAAGAEAVSGATPAAAEVVAVSGATADPGAAGAASGATPAAAGAEAVSGATPAAAGAEAVSGATPAATGAEAVSGATPVAAGAEAVSGATVEPAAGAASGATIQPDSNAVTAIADAAASGATAQSAASGATISVPEGAAITAEANAIEGVTATGATLASEAHEGSAAEAATVAGSGNGHSVAPGVQTSTVEGVSGVLNGASVRPEVEGSGEASNDTSLFASAAHAVEALPEGSGTEGSGEVAKVEVHGTEAQNTITGTGATAEEGSGEGVAKITVPGEGSGSSPVPSAVSVEGSGEVAAGGGVAKFVGTAETEEIEGQPLVLAKAVEPTVVNVLKNGCADDHTDIHVCEQYFEDYLGKVKAWADKHDQVFEKNMWKACKLLSQVKHVPTLCCSKFYSTCSVHMETRR